MSFQEKFLQTVSNQPAALRREVYAAVTHPTYTREQKVNAISAAVIYHRQAQSSSSHNASSHNTFTFRR